MALAVSSRSPPGPRTLHHHYYGCTAWLKFWDEFWFGLTVDPFFPPTTAWPLLFPKLFTELMVVVGPPPAPFPAPLLPPRFWIRTPSTSPLLLLVLLLLPL